MKIMQNSKISWTHHTFKSLDRVPTRFSRLRQLLCRALLTAKGEEHYPWANATNTATISVAAPSKAAYRLSTPEWRIGNVWPRSTSEKRSKNASGSPRSSRLSNRGLSGRWFPKALESHDPPRCKRDRYGHAGWAPTGTKVHRIGSW